MNSLFTKMGSRLADFLSRPLPGYEEFSTIPVAKMRETLRPGDLLLVEGNSRISTAIKYLTQSTWSHVALYIGHDAALRYQCPQAQLPLLEADLEQGVITVPLEKYAHLNVRICRPVSLNDDDRDALLQFALARLGYQYDLKNIVDLMRYLLPTPPVPVRFRRRMIQFGSGDPTKAICSTLIAQAFQSIAYPILPRLQGECEDCDESLLMRRHFSHFTPRDFDLSPYFQIVKPTLEQGFNHRSLRWADVDVPVNS